MHASTRPARRARQLLGAFVLLIASASALAAPAGKLVFVTGSVTLEAGARPLKVGDPVSSGDTVVTASGARAQLLMGDGAKIALRAGSRFRIDEFQLAATVRDPGAATVATSTGRSVSTLLKGGFRTVSGSIGKGDPAAYEVRVPVGTLGIRGTDYVAVYCRDDCTDAPGLKPGEPVRNGLYLGVYSGRIVFRGGGIELFVDAGEFVFIPVPSLKPEPLKEPPSPVKGDGAGPLDFAGGGGAGAAGRAALTETGINHLNDRRGPKPPQPTDTSVPPATDPTQPITGELKGQPIDLTPAQVPPRTLGSAYAPGSLPGVLGPAALSAGEQFYAFGGAPAGATTVPVRTDAGPAELSIGTAIASDTGSDPTTGLSWGRWSGGSVDLVTAARGSTPLPLGSDSFHWVTGAAYTDARTPVLPLSGSAVYGVVGATSPTSAGGVVGTFGGAWLSADFTNRTLDATLAVRVAGLDWYATAAGQPIGGSLTVQGSWTGSVANVAPVFGQFSAVFTPSADTSAALPVIAMGYDLSMGTGAVSGVIALAPNAGAQPPAPPPLGPRDIAIAYSSDLGNGEQGQAAVATNAPGQYALQGAPGVAVDLVQLGDGMGTSATIGTATVAESGTDPTTFLRWGRWSGGVAQLQGAAGQTALDLSQRSLHWITPGDFGATPVMPITGSRIYDVVGGTSPTDAAGNVGTLGSLTLTADFSKNSVAASIALSIANTTWTAQGAGAIGARANLPAQQFFGTFSPPTIGGVVQNAGGGQFNGFFSNLPGQTTGAPGAAGLTYFLTAPGAGVVSGAAALVGR